MNTKIYLKNSHIKYILYIYVISFKFNYIPYKIDKSDYLYLFTIKLL